VRTTSVKLAQAAHALQTAILAGPSGLEEGPAELVVAAEARDQVLADLITIHEHLFADLDESVAVGPADMLRHPALGLGAVLRSRERTGLHGPSPTDLAIRSPTLPTARAWVAAASGVEAAAVDATRARPDREYAAWTWAHGRSAAQVPDPVTPPVIAWALVADLAALSCAVASLDDDLAAALVGSGHADLVAAGHRLIGPSVDDLKITASLALRLAEAGETPSAYHLPSGAKGAITVSSLPSVPDALDRALDLLQAAPTLTGPQQRALATSIASIAQQLSMDAPASARAPLKNLARGAAGYAATWANSPLVAANSGDVDAVQQVRSVARLMQVDPPRWDSTPDGAAIREALERSAERLPAIVRAAAENLREGLAAHRFLIPSHPGATGSGWGPAAGHPDRRPTETAAFQLEKLADRLGQALGPRRAARPLTDVVTQPPARELLRAALESPVTRPEHPALAPTRWRGRLSSAPPVRRGR
jgi:hypothetical protein